MPYSRSVGEGEATVQAWLSCPGINSLNLVYNASGKKWRSLCGPGGPVNNARVMFSNISALLVERTAPAEPVLLGADLTAACLAI
eukprot:4176578-Pyramimonas_sp.AAC.1